MNNRSFQWGIAGTLIWLAGIGLYSFFGGLVLPASLNELGDALAGVFAPVAFLWLVIGYMQQGKQLEQNTIALEQQERALQLQIDEMRETVKQQKIMTEIQKKQYDISLKSVLPSFIAEVSSFLKRDKDGEIVFQLTMSWKNIGAEISDFLVISHDTEITIFKEDILKRGDKSDFSTFDTSEHVILDIFEEYACIAFRVFYIDQLKNHHSELHVVRMSKESLEHGNPFIYGIDLVEDKYTCGNKL